MMKPSKRFMDRAKTHLKRYQKVLESARTRDVNESDTCVILTDFLADVLGYGKYSEITTEFAIRSTFCDLAIKSGGRLQYLIEVKSVGTDLRENHIKQAVDYAANQGVEWVLLTNGAQWRAFKLRFEKPIQYEEVFQVDLLDGAAKPSELLQKLYLVSRDAGGGAAIGTYYQQKEATSRYVIAQVLLSDTALNLVRRELRQLFPGIRIQPEEIATQLRSEILKRDALEGEKAVAAERLVRRKARRRSRTREAGDEQAKTPSTVSAETAQLRSTLGEAQPKLEPA